MIFTSLQNGFSIFSTQIIVSVGAKITKHKEQHFINHKVGALKLNTYFLDKQFPTKQRGDNTCMIDFVWHQCCSRKRFRTYSYDKLQQELSECVACFPLMSTRELVEWARACHPNVSIHAYDPKDRKFIKHTVHPCDISLVNFVKDKHCYPITDERLKTIATKDNKGGADNLWRYMSEIKWSRRHEQITGLRDLNEEENLGVSNQIIVLREEAKIEPVIDQYIMRTNYFVEYLHSDNNGRLDGFLDHKDNVCFE